jgi:ParB family chromosome partitioning protein
MKRKISDKKSAGTQSKTTMPATVETGQVSPEVIQNIDLSMIVCNSFNPRKYRTEEDLAELKTSILNYGIIQPITVRRKNGVYEIVCGERRFYASRLAGLSTIPALVKDYSDEDAMEICILENLQRRDISPIEEAVSFGKLMEVRGYSIEELVLKFGKTDKYIRSRLQLRNLIEKNSELLVREEISLAIALELSRFCPDIQEEVHREHLQDDNFSWKKLSAKDFRRLLEQGYSMDLSNYEFNKGDCKNCQSNSSIYDLFLDGNCGICQNIECLRYKQAEYMAVETTRMMEEKKGMIAGICVAPNSFASAEVVGNLADTGCDIYEMSANPMPVKPIMPVQDDFVTDVEFVEAEATYERRLEQHHTQTAHIEEMVQEGKAEMVVDVSKRKPELCYRIIPENAATQSEEDAVEKLRKQDIRNREIAIEKGVEDVKQLVREKIIPPSDFQPLEEGLLYYVMLASLRKEHYEELGINNRYSLSEEDRAGIIASLTEEQKNIIRRGFLVKHLSDTFGDRKQSHLLLEFATLHFPDEVGKIKQQHNEVYKKRHIRTNERILALQPATVQNLKNAVVLPEDFLPESIPTMVTEIQSDESVPTTDTITAESWEAFVAETSNDFDLDALNLHPGQPENAAIGEIPEEDEKILDTVYEESAA